MNYLMIAQYMAAAALLTIAMTHLLIWVRVRNQKPDANAWWRMGMATRLHIVPSPVYDTVAKINLNGTGA